MTVRLRCHRCGDLAGNVKTTGRHLRLAVRERTPRPGGLRNTTTEETLFVDPRWPGTGLDIDGQRWLCPGCGQPVAIDAGRLAAGLRAAARKGVADISLVAG